MNQCKEHGKQSKIDCEDCTNRKRFNLVGTYGHIVEIYSESNSINSVGDDVGLTRQRISQILQEFDRLGLFQYQRVNNRMLCGLMKRLPAALKKAKSQAELARLCGYPRTGKIGNAYLTNPLRRLGIRIGDLKPRFAENRKKFLTEELHKCAKKIGQAGIYNAYVIQSLKTARNLTNKVMRAYGMRRMSELRIHMKAYEKSLEEVDGKVVNGY